MVADGRVDCRWVLVLVMVIVGSRCDLDLELDR